MTLNQPIDSRMGSGRRAEATHQLSQPWLRANGDSHLGYQGEPMSSLSATNVSGGTHWLA